MYVLKILKVCSGKIFLSPFLLDPRHTTERAQSPLIANPKDGSVGVTATIPLMLPQQGGGEGLGRVPHKVDAGHFASDTLPSPSPQPCQALLPLLWVREQRLGEMNNLPVQHGW